MTQLQPPGAAKLEQVVRAATRRIQVEAAAASAGPTFTLIGTDRASDAPVVMRVLRPEFGAISGAVARFIRGGEQAARVSSPYLAKLLEVGRLPDDGPPYWLVERLPGSSLRELVASGKPVALRIVVDYALEICEALAAAHGCQLVHGQLRPSKVFRVPVADPVRIKVIDLGLAAATIAAPVRGASLPPSGEIAGPEYRSPETVAGSRRFEVSTDLWGLGLVTFELLTGRHPFATATTRSALARAVAEGPAPLRNLGLNVPTSLEDLLRELLRKDASQRPPSANAVAERLRAIAASLGSDRSSRGARGAAEADPRAEAGSSAGARAAATATAHSDALGAASGGPSPRARPNEAAATAEPAPADGPVSSGRPRFLGPALGNLGRRGGGYSLSGGSLPREEVMGRRRAGAGRRTDRISKKPSQRPRKSRPSLAQRRSEPPGGRPTASSQPSESAPRRRSPMLRTDPATPRAMEERHETAEHGPSATPGAPPTAPTSPAAASPAAALQAVAASPAAALEAVAASPAAALQAVAASPAAARQPPAAPISAAVELEIDLDSTALPGRVRSAPPRAASGPAPAPADVRGRAPIAEDAAALDETARARLKLRTAPGSWTLDLHHGPGSWELERTPSVPPVRGAADSSPGARPAAGARGSAPGRAPPSSHGGAEEPEVSVAVEEQFGPYQVERLVHVGPQVERIAAVALEGPLEGVPVFIDRGTAEVAVDEDRCRRVGEIGRAASHPNLLDILEAGVIDETPYLAFEQVDGIDLRTLLRSLAAEPTESVVALAAYVVRRAALGLDAFHRALDAEPSARERVHGDVRPSNIALSLSGEVKLGPPSIVCDERGARLGKLDFMAPEELRGEPLDTTADTFALGVVLGEMLIGGPVFPGRGVDVLMALDRVAIEPLRDRSQGWPEGLLHVCERALQRQPGARFGSAADFAAALEPFQKSGAEGAAMLALRVRTARDGAAREGRSITTGEPERTGATSLPADAVAAPRDGTDDVSRLARVRRAHSGLIGQMPIAGLLEAVATGNLGPDDEAALRSETFQPLRSIPLCAERLLLSAPALKGNLTERRAADHVYQSRDVPILEALAQMRLCHANAFVLVEDLAAESNRRTEIYLREGVVVGVRSSDPSELVGERLVRLGLLQRPQLDDACRVLERFEGQLGNALVGLGFIDAITLFRAIHEQACARIARLFTYPESRARVYLGQGPAPSPFGLQIDLTQAMMAGVLEASDQDPAALLPGMLAQLEPGARAPSTEAREMQELPPVLRETARLAGTRMVVAQAIRTLEASAGVSSRVACAALVVAQALRWITLRAPGS